MTQRREQATRSKCADENTANNAGTDDKIDRGMQMSKRYYGFDQRVQGIRHTALRGGSEHDQWDEPRDEQCRHQTRSHTYTWCFNHTDVPERKEDGQMLSPESVHQQECQRGIEETAHQRHTDKGAPERAAVRGDYCQAALSKKDTDDDPHHEINSSNIERKCRSLVSDRYGNYIQRFATRETALQMQESVSPPECNKPHQSARYHHDNCKH